MAKNIIKNPGRALESGANVGTATLSSLPGVIISITSEKAKKILNKD